MFVDHGALVSACFKDDSVPIKIHLTALELKEETRPHTREQRAGPRTILSLSLFTNNVQSAEFTPYVRMNEKGWENTAKQGEKSSFHKTQRKS